MLMTKEHVARIARNTEQSIKDISTIDAVKKRVGEIDGDSVDDDHGGEEYIQVIAHPQSPGAFVIQYVRRTGQTPLQIIVNPARSYLKLMLTCVDTLPGYNTFQEMSELGKFQDKTFPLDFAALHKELKMLSALK